MKIITGGLKLKNIEKYPPGSGFNPIMDMINSEGSNLSLLTYSSLYGFMITLDVTKENSNYFGLNSTYTKFNVPVTSFILKLAVITERSTRLPEYMGVTKSTETQDRFLSEAKLQQSIWEKTIVGGREGVCPSVVNLAFFNNHESKSLLRQIMDKILKDRSETYFEYITGRNKSELIEMIDYLDRILSLHPTYEIGILVMPNIQNSVTFHKFLYMNNTDINVIKDVVTKIVTKILRLYVNAKVIHMDLHQNNILVYSTDNGETRVMLIDFGRASSIDNNTDDRYLNSIDKKIMNNQADSIFDSIFNINLNDTFNTNVIFLLGKYYDNWFRNYEIIKNDVFQLLKNEMSVTRSNITNTTIQRYKNRGWLIDFEREHDQEVRYPDIYTPNVVNKTVLTFDDKSSPVNPRTPTASHPAFFAVPEYREDDYESTVVNDIDLVDESSSKMNKTKRLFSMQDEDADMGPRIKKRQSTFHEETLIDQNGGKSTRNKKLMRSSRNKRFKSKRIINAKKRKWTLKKKRNLH
jgi:hypothetical protein